MIEFKNTTNTKVFNSGLKKIKPSRKLNFSTGLKKSTVHKGSTIVFAISLAACNSSTVPVESCSDSEALSGIICLDNELTNTSNGALINTIDMPTNQIPVLGTLESDNFVASSRFLTNKTMINGGEGNDTLTLNLKNSVKSSPKIESIENFLITSYGNFSLDLKNVRDLEYVLLEDSLGHVTLNNLTDPSTVFGFKGNGINSTIVTNNDLGGTSDLLKLKLIEASKVSFQAPLGYEEIEIELIGNSSLMHLLANGVTTAKINGIGNLMIDANLSGLNSFSSIDLNGKIVGSTLDHDGFS